MFFDVFQILMLHQAYASSLGEDGTNDEYLAIAAHFESKKAYVEASEYYSMCADFVRALKLCLQAGDDAGIQGAIQVIRKCAGRPEREALIRILHDFLTGDIDGKVKDPHHMFRLHMAIGDYAQAATTAILIAQQEQAAGNYKVAHSILFETQQDLSQQKIAVPRDMSRQLSLLHSYIISKRLVGRKEHTRAARMLLRVAKNISKFPAHVVPILTSTVVECQRANMKQARASILVATTTKM
jgi:WD repeat-containing protein 19